MVYTAYAAQVRESMLLELLGRVAFDTDTGCWYPPPHSTDYIGRAIWQLWYDKKPLDYRPSVNCERRGGEPCVNPIHVQASVGGLDPQLWLESQMAA